MDIRRNLSKTVPSDCKLPYIIVNKQIIKLVRKKENNLSDKRKLERSIRSLISKNMKLEYARIDVLSIINVSQFGMTTLDRPHTYDDNLEWLHGLADVEYRHDYQCFFVLKGSPSYTAIAMKLGDVFD